MGLFKSVEREITDHMVVSVDRPGQRNPKNKDERTAVVKLKSGYQIELVSDLAEHVTAMMGLHLDSVKGAKIEASGKLIIPPYFLQAFGSGSYCRFKGSIKIDRAVKYICYPNKAENAAGSDIAYFEKVRAK